MAAPTTPDTVTITPATRQRWLPPVLVTLALSSQLPNVLRHSADPSINHLDATWRYYWLVTFVPLYAIALFVFSLPVRVELGETTLVLRRPLRRRRVLPWRNIQCILVDQRGSRRRVAVYGDDPDGRRTILPAPFTTFLGNDPRFEEKFHLVGQAWLARRGDDWVELPPPRPGWLAAADAQTNSAQS
jgi:hypothetical protein